MSPLSRAIVVVSALLLWVLLVAAIPIEAARVPLPPTPPATQGPKPTGGPRPTDPPVLQAVLTAEWVGVRQDTLRLTWQGDGVALWRYGIDQSEPYIVATTPGVYDLKSGDLALRPLPEDLYVVRGPSSEWITSVHAPPYHYEVTLPIIARP